jgi:hypothetical protein
VIDIVGPVPAGAHGGCIECDPTDDRAADDDLFVFVLGGQKTRVCRVHLAMLGESVTRKLAGPSRL